MNVGEICKRGVVTIHADRPLLEAAERMRRFHVGDLVVVDPEEAHPVPIGILTDRDIAVGIVAQDVDHLAQLTVGDVLSERDLVSIAPSDSVLTAVQRMRDQGVRRLPVIDDSETLVGIFTMDDALGVLADHLTALSTLVHVQQRQEFDSRP